MSKEFPWQLYFEEIPAERKMYRLLSRIKRRENAQLMLPLIHNIKK